MHLEAMGTPLSPRAAQTPACASHAPENNLSDKQSSILGLDIRASAPEQPSDLPNTNGPRTFQQQVVLEMRKQESLHQQERRLQRQKQQQLLFPMLPSDLLQPSCDNLSTSALQLGRWLGVRRLVSKAARIGHVRGAWGAYVPATGRLAAVHVSVPSPRPASMGTPPGGSNAAAGSGAAGIGQGGGAVAPPPLPPPPPPPPGAADPLPLGVQHQQQEQHPDAPEAGDLLPEERFKLQVVAACGGGLVATGHPDGRVLGCGRGPVVALTADEGLLAVAYRREVLGRCGTTGDPGGPLAAQLAGQGHPNPSPHPTSECIRWVRQLTTSIQPNLADQRRINLVPGGVLFVASSSPSFLGNNFLQFEVEVAAIDLAAVVAAAAAVATAAAAAGAHSAPDDGGGGGGDGGVPDGVVGRTGGAGGELPAGTSATACTAAATAPFVIRTVTPPQQYVLRGAPLSEFKWDQPLQMCLTGGLLLLRCLQFPLAPGKLAWPGLFAFRMGDLVSGLALGRQCSSGGSGPGAPSAAAFPAGTDGLAAAAAAAQPPLLPAPTAVLCRTIQPDVLCGDGGFVATDEEAMFIGEGRAECALPK
ncbi:hypothetical protein VOLCADRAFT_94012 [Volvox carteri f. nagariensis]|uniref:Uncharacterized protein n=1 Tax=Volvox carteri f. nagariensis TaxID=3068 RepID=D8U3N9_VOLCA|nr:uncharacterized protein VOLCADRAFT_94012 [Volvox carteri f. nagariensis]EFJ45642.1 hypothetical protein VOLCADRAFT_94012 [Volvox carteri f. nagariensis]|eukprot:XP_002953332.1 hypothetical protein VOLCADRAFT_94012 [Volvox carteri f. nagariensis]